MSNGARTVCFSCGHPVGDPPALHRLANGQACVACRDRLLEHLPPVLPRATAVAPVPLAELEAVERGLFDASGDEGYPPEPPEDPDA
jgi:hypothetical protein